MLSQRKICYDAKVAKDSNYSCPVFLKQLQNTHTQSDYFLDQLFKRRTVKKGRTNSFTFLAHPSAKILLFSLLLDFPLLSITFRNGFLYLYHQ